MDERGFTNRNVENYPESSGHQTSETDRRDGGRYRTVCRVAKILRKGDVGLWRVRNISDKGMMLSADVPIEKGEALQIALSDDSILSGTVVWAEKGRCGVELDVSVDSAALLRQLADAQRSGDLRAPRLPIRIEARAKVAGETAPIDLVDLSQSGAGFLHDGQYQAGMTLELEIGDGIKRQAIVRWVTGSRGGLWLTQPIDRADLESLKRAEGRTED